MQIDKFYSRLKNEFDGYSKDIPIPVPIEREAMDDLMEALVDAEFTTEECAARLGVHPITGVSFHREPFAPDLVTTLIDLFIFQQSVSLSLLENIFAPDQIKDLTRMNLIQVFNNTVSSEVCFFPCYGKYFATDHRQHNDFINQVMPLFGESYILGGIVDRKPLARTLDLCTGSGVHAILAAHHSEEVIGVDINPRAIGFANFNAALAGVDNVKFELGDLYAKVSGQFDLILANPPYNPDDGTEAGENFWSGGKSGTEILSRIIEGFSTYLADGGVSNIISLYPNEPGTLLKD